VSYGFGWGIMNESPLGKMVYHRGGHPGFVTNYVRYPDKDMMIIVCRNVESQESFTPFWQGVRDSLGEL
jgi:hypothetical protein